MTYRSATRRYPSAARVPAHAEDPQLRGRWQPVPAQAHAQEFQLLPQQLNCHPAVLPTSVLPRARRTPRGCGRCAAARAPPAPAARARPGDATDHLRPLQGDALRAQRLRGAARTDDGLRDSRPAALHGRLRIMHRREHPTGF